MTNANTKLRADCPRYRLRSASATAPAAHWASWADALSVASHCSASHDTVGERGRDWIFGRVAQEPWTGVVSSVDQVGLSCRHAVDHHLTQQLNLANGSMAGSTTPLPPSSSTFRRPQCLPSHLLPIRPNCGPATSEVLCGTPTSPEFQLQPSIFMTTVLQRVRLPLGVTEAICECGGFLDTLARHRAACPETGRLRSRAVGPERTLARVCREAGAVVRQNVKLRDMKRAVEVLASGLPQQHGAQLPVDTTIWSALTTCGRACTNAAVVNGAALTKARRDSQVKYAELAQGARVVLAVETGGRWSEEAASFAADLASARCREAPPDSRRSAMLAWRRRWTPTLPVSCNRAFASFPGSRDSVTSS